VKDGAGMKYEVIVFCHPTLKASGYSGKAC
jgi:hypothetical protein